MLALRYRIAKALAAKQRSTKKGMDLQKRQDQPTAEIRNLAEPVQIQSKLCGRNPLLRKQAFRRLAENVLLQRLPKPARNQNENEQRAAAENGRWL